MLLDDDRVRDGETVAGAFADVSRGGCPSCHSHHPPLTTCAGGWAPWDGEPVIVTREERRPPPPVVHLPPQDLLAAEGYAEHRRNNHARLRLEDRAGLVLEEEDRFALDLDGILGEMAVARWLRIVYVHTPEPIRLPDVGPAHVRATRHRYGHLIVRPRDPEGPFVLVVIRSPDFVIPGWIPSRVARTFPLRRPDLSRPAAHLIPQKDLRPLPPGADGIRALGSPG